MGNRSENGRPAILRGYLQTRIGGAPTSEGTGPIEGERFTLALVYPSNRVSDCRDTILNDPLLSGVPRISHQIRSTVADHLRYNPTAEVLVTGHSLGGALAILCFLDLYEFLGASATGSNGNNVSFAPLHLFGAPRVGNAAFAEFAASRGVPIYR